MGENKRIVKRYLREKVFSMIDFIGFILGYIFKIFKVVVYYKI